MVAYCVTVPVCSRQCRFSCASIQKRKFYIRGVVTGVLHMMAFAQLVVAMITLTAGIMLILTTIPILLQAITGFV